MAKVQSVRFGDTTVDIQTIVINSITCLRLKDVQLRFPAASALCIDNQQMLFLLLPIL